MADGKGKRWVLLAASSKGWENYRHQANVCHAYQVVHKFGIPDEQIVVMMYDDIANNKANPVPGNIINVPSGPNVYPGVPKDYTGEDVSAQNFLAVLSGDLSAVKKTGPKKVIKSGKNDSIFIYIAGHGGQGIFMFPNSALYETDLIQTANGMAQNHKFSKMVFYMDSCHSGPMLNQLQDKNVYAVTACKPEEPSHACCLDLKRNVYLTDLFTVYWLHQTENKNPSLISLEDQFFYLKTNVTQTAEQAEVNQTPCNYGDMSMLKLKLSEFLGGSHVSQAYASQPLDVSVSDVVDATEAPLRILENRIKNVQDPGERSGLEKQYNDLKRKRGTVDEALKKITERTNASRALTEKRELTRLDKLKAVAEHFKKNLFNWEKEQFVVTRPHLQVLVNLCESDLEVEKIAEAITHVGRQTTF